MTGIQRLIKEVKREARTTDVDNGFTEPWYTKIIVMIAIGLLISLFVL
jgi:hypothetical protein